MDFGVKTLTSVVSGSLMESVYPKGVQCITRFGSLIIYGLPLYSIKLPSGRFPSLSLYVNLLPFGLIRSRCSISSISPIGVFILYIYNELPCTQAALKRLKSALLHSAQGR